jgi:hypothetical protein
MPPPQAVDSLTRISLGGTVGMENWGASEGMPVYRQKDAQGIL